MGPQATSSIVSILGESLHDVGPSRLHTTAGLKGAHANVVKFAVTVSFLLCYCWWNAFWTSVEHCLLLSFNKNDMRWKNTHAKTLLIIIPETDADTHLQMEYYLSLLYENRCIYVPNNAKLCLQRFCSAYKYIVSPNLNRNYAVSLEEVDFSHVVW